MTSTNASRYENKDLFYNGTTARFFYTIIFEEGAAIDEFTFTFSKATAAGVDFAFLVNLISNYLTTVLTEPRVVAAIYELAA